jgi:outer membrane lipoprotein SlyB
MKTLYRKLYAVIVGAVVGMIVGGILVAIVLDIRQWNTFGLTLGFIVVQILWAIIGGMCGWAIDSAMNKDDV